MATSREKKLEHGDDLDMVEEDPALDVQEDGKIIEHKTSENENNEGLIVMPEDHIVSEEESRVEETKHYSDGS